MGTKIAQTCSAFSHCCQGLLQESEGNPDKLFHRIVTNDETWVYYYDRLSEQEAKIWKKAGGEIPTRLCRTRPPEKIIMVIFWDKSDTLLNEYLPGGITISDPSYASVIDRLHCAIVEKGGGNVPVDKGNIVHTAIGKADFIELNDPASSPDLALSDYYLLSKLNKFVRGQNFSRDDEVIDTVEEYLNKLN